MILDLFVIRTLLATFDFGGSNFAGLGCFLLAAFFQNSVHLALHHTKDLECEANIEYVQRVAHDPNWNSKPAVAVVFHQVIGDPCSTDNASKKERKCKQYIEQHAASALEKLDKPTQMKKNIAALSERQSNSSLKCSVVHNQHRDAKPN